MKTPTLRLIAAGIAIALLIASASAFLASRSPDGLNRVAEQQGFGNQAQAAPYRALPGYTVPGLGEGRLSKVAAGVIGVAVVTALTVGAGTLLRRRGQGR
jgi:hypothetical protein